MNIHGTAQLCIWSVNCKVLQSTGSLSALEVLFRVAKSGWSVEIILNQDYQSKTIVKISYPFAPIRSVLPDRSALGRVCNLSRNSRDFGIRTPTIIEKDTYVGWCHSESHSSLGYWCWLGKETVVLPGWSPDVPTGDKIGRKVRVGDTFTPRRPHLFLRNLSTLSISNAIPRLAFDLVWNGGAPCR